MNEKLQNPEYTVRNPNRGGWIYAIVLVAILGLAGLGWKQWTEYTKAKDELARKQQAPAAPVNIDPLVVTYPGTIRAKKTILIAAPVAGTMEGVEVADGQEVFEGQLLARISNTSLSAAKEKAEIDLNSTKSKANDLESQVLAARLEASRAAADAVRLRGESSVAAKVLERQVLLYREGATARKTYEAAQTDFARLTSESKIADETAKRSEAALRATVASLDEARRRIKEREADLEDAGAQLATGEVHSPVDGILMSHKRNSGEEVTREIQDLFEIATDLTELEVLVELPAAVVGKVTAGMPALLNIAEAGAASLEAKVREVKGNQALVDFIVPSEQVRPGLTARVRFLPGNGGQ